MQHIIKRLVIWSAAVGATLSLNAAPDPNQLAVSGRSNATPSLAVAGDVVALAWGASDSSGATDIFAAISRDAGASFGTAVRVNDLDGDARVNGEQPPRIVMQPSAITVVWTTKGATGTVLKQARSVDGGRSFQRAAAVPGGTAAGNRGWEAIAVDPGGRVDAIWLDHRELAKDDAPVEATHHQHGGGGGSAATGAKPDGVAMAQRSKLYFAGLDGTVAPHAVTGGVCYCCKTALASGANGVLYAAWRHVYPGNLRDIAFTMSRDGGRTFDAPSRVSEDKWVLEGCPDDGPSMAVDSRNRVHIAWPTLVSAPNRSDPAIALFYATTTDGRRFTARERIPTEGMPHHPQLAIAADGSATIVWDESSSGTRRVVMARARADASGKTQFRRDVVSTGDSGVYPVVAQTSAATLVAWTSGTGAASVIRTRLVK